MYLLPGSDDFRVDGGDCREVAPGVHVMGESKNPLVPNIGVVIGEHSILMIDTGAGIANGERAYELLSRLGERRQCLLSFTHIHPEHYTGFPAFESRALILCHARQAEDAARLRARSKGAPRNDILALVPDRPLRPDIVYRASSRILDLGGKRVRISNWGTAHSSSDATFHVLEEGVIFTGDLVEEGSFPIFPWFPPHATAVDGANWAEIIRACLAEQPRLVVPGHGRVGSRELLLRYLEYLKGLPREIARETFGSGAENALIEAVEARMTARFPDWAGRGWIGPAVRHFIAVGTRSHAEAGRLPAGRD